MKHFLQRKIYNTAQCCGFLSSVSSWQSWRLALYRAKMTMAHTLNGVTPTDFLTLNVLVPQNILLNMEKFEFPLISLL